MSEQTFLNEGGIQVTNARFIAKGRTYAVNGITSVCSSEIKREQPTYHDVVPAQPSLDHTLLSSKLPLRTPVQVYRLGLPFRPPLKFDFRCGFSPSVSEVLLRFPPAHVGL